MTGAVVKIFGLCIAAMAREESSLSVLNLDEKNGGQKPKSYGWRSLLGAQKSCNTFSCVAQFFFLGSSKKVTYDHLLPCLPCSITCVASAKSHTSRGRRELGGRFARRDINDLGTRGPKLVIFISLSPLSVGRKEDKLLSTRSKFWGKRKEWFFWMFKDGNGK